MPIPKKVKESLDSLLFRSGSINEMIKTLILKGIIIESPTTSEEVASQINDRFGEVVKTSHINVYMKPFQRKGIVVGYAVREGKAKRKIWLGSWIPKENFISSYKTRGIPFSKELVDALGKKFDIEINDLHLVYGKSGDCTAFLLRKILEKSIFLSFAKQGLLDKLRDSQGNFRGLEEMIGIASNEKIKGVPFILPKTAKQIKGIKFLGDAAAHNFLINIKPDDITPYLPFIVTALKELSQKL